MALLKCVIIGIIFGMLILCPNTCKAQNNIQLTLNKTIVFFDKYFVL